MYAHVCTYLSAGTHRGQKRMLESLALAVVVAGDHSLVLCKSSTHSLSHLLSPREYFS